MDCLPGARPERHPSCSQVSHGAIAEGWKLMKGWVGDNTRLKGDVGAPATTAPSLSLAAKPPIT